jgi:excisionase family DNA binding protein
MVESDQSSHPSVIDTAQVADLLRMNVQMVRKYAREGRLPAYQLPGSRVYRFIHSEIIDYIRAHPVVPEGSQTAQTS